MFEEVINTLGEVYLFLKPINNVLGKVLSALVVYKTAYYVLGLFFTRKFKKAKKNHKYAIVIAARNEEKVIGNLLDSINRQDYPKKLLTVFVVADNCTDSTAKIAREHKAICYERFDNEHKTKGFALQYLFKQIEKDYKTSSFEGYFVFDADNLLNKDYITKMNDAFDEGCKIITSYRNTKNFDENWISSTYALHWIRSSRTNHRTRSFLRLATNIQGTGFLFSNEIVKDGWKYTSLTEDRALTADAVAQGYQITYQDEAVFYDEQPVSLKVALRQRLRWSRGHLEAFCESGPYLFLNIFLGKRYIKTKWNKEDNKNEKLSKRIIESIRHRFASYDTLMQLTPFVIVNIFRWLLVSVILYSLYAYGSGLDNINLFSGGSYLAKLLRKIVDYRITVYPGVNAMIMAFILQLWFRLIYRVGAYLANTLKAVYLFITDRKRIKKMSLAKKALYTLTWPIFDIIGRYTTYAALFVKVTWKPIPHESKITIDDINKSVVNK